MNNNHITLELSGRLIGSVLVAKYALTSFFATGISTSLLKVKMYSPGKCIFISLFVSSLTITLPASPYDSILFAITASTPKISYLTISVPIIPP